MIVAYFEHDTEGPTCPLYNSNIIVYSRLSTGRDTEYEFINFSVNNLQNFSKGTGARNSKYTIELIH